MESVPDIDAIRSRALLQFCRLLLSKAAANLGIGVDTSLFPEAVQIAEAVTYNEFQYTPAMDTKAEHFCESLDAWKLSGSRADLRSVLLASVSFGLEAMNGLPQDESAVRASIRAVYLEALRNENFSTVHFLKHHLNGNSLPQIGDDLFPSAEREMLDAMIGNAVPAGTT